MIDVNKQFADRGGKQRSFIHQKLCRAGYAVMPLTALPWSPPSVPSSPDAGLSPLHVTRPPMLSGLSLDVLPTMVTPSIRRIVLGDVVQLASLRNGVVYEQWQGAVELEAQQLELMTANVKRASALSLMPD